MSATRKTAWVRGTLLLAAATLAGLAGACGEDDFKNRDRAPVAIELTGVIQDDKVTVSPNGKGNTKLGAGPFLITISNQTDAAHTITLDGERIRERVGPVNPQDTATLQKSLVTGTYEVRAGSNKAVRKEIKPAELVVGAKRKDSNDQLLLP
jgi:hypothetical protein